MRESDYRRVGLNPQTRDHVINAECGKRPDAGDGPGRFNVTPDMQRAKRQLGDRQSINPARRGWARPSTLIRWVRHRPPSVDRAVRVCVNLAGSAFAAWFAQASFEYFVQTHRLIVVLQLAGLILVIGSLAALGRSFGFVAADRGVVTRGPYAVVRHPVYASYLLIQGGYVVQAASWRNLVVLIFAMACNIGRIIAEEKVLSGSPAYRAYRQRVRFRILPGLW